MMIDLDAHIIPAVSENRIPTRNKGKEIVYRAVHLVVKVTAPAFLPLTLKVARCKRYLVRTRTDGGLEGNPVAIRKEGDTASRRITGVSQASGCVEALLSTNPRVLQFPLTQVSNAREVGRVVEERAVGHDLMVRAIVDKTLDIDGQIEVESETLPWRQRIT